MSSRTKAPWSRREFVKIGGTAFAGSVLSAPLASLVSAQTAGFDFYISPTGSDSNPGTLSSPWSLAALNSKRAVYAGRRVGLLDGTYNCNAEMYANQDSYRPTFNIAGGTASSPTVIQAVNPRGAHITAKLNGVYGGRPTAENCGMIGNNFLYDGVSAGYVVIDGLKLSGVKSTLLRFGLLDSASGSRLTPGIVVRNCELTDCNATGDAAGGNKATISLNNCDAATLQNNWIHDNVGYGIGNPDHLSALIIWNSRNTVVEYNSIESSGAGGIYSKRGGGYVYHYGGVVRYNYVDVTGFSSTESSGICDWTGNPGVVVPGSELRIHNNVVVSSRGIALDCGNVANTRSSNERQLIYNNTIIAAEGIDPGRGGFFSTTAHSPGVSFFNNLCWGSNVGLPMADYGAVMMPLGPAGVLDFNIYPATVARWTTFQNNAGAYPSASYGSLAAWKGATSKEAASVSVTNPGFRGTGSRAELYRLQSNSPAIGAGRVDGLTGSGGVDVGAWGNSASSVGCSFATGQGFRPGAPSLTVS